MAEKDGGPAFPREDYQADDAPGQRGMSLRDYFAGQALVALGDHKAVIARGVPWLSEHAYLVADAMLKERAKR